MRIHVAVFSCLAVIASAAHAEIYFSDNFDTAVAGPNTWPGNGWFRDNFGSGSLDILGPGYRDPLPGNGNYVDLTGSTGVPGRLYTGPAAAQLGHTYSVTFSLAGSQQSHTQSVKVDFGPLSEIYVLAPDAPFVTNSLSFHVGPGAYPTGIWQFSVYHDVFGSPSLYDEGALLDKVVIANDVSAVPELPSLALTIAGLALVGASSRRQFALKNSVAPELFATRQA